MYCGIDVGGTTIKAGLVDDDGKITARKSIRVTYGQVDFPRYLSKTMAEAVGTLLEDGGLSAADLPYVGAGFPGSVDDGKGQFLFAPNMPIHEAPIRELFREYCPIPLRMGNDANCAALGEFRAGAGKDYRSLVLITIGTGVGTGIILDGKMWTGCNSAGAEGGHISLNPNGPLCGCGRRGCLEAYASASGLIRMTVDKMLNYKDSLLWKTAENSLDKVNGETVFRAARLGDERAKEVLDEYLGYLGEGILNIINLLQPDVVVLGGGISNADDDLFLEPLKKKMEGRDMAKYSLPKTKIVKATLGNDAGLIGAAFLEA